MGYTSIHISYDEGTLCEEISFSEPGEQSYTIGDIITLSDPILSRDRQLIVRNVNYTEEGTEGLFTTVSGFSPEYIYTRKSPDCDISFFTMTSTEKDTYETKNPNPDSEVFIMLGDTYGIGGWSMHSIVEKIATEWMELSIQNNLPDYWISDYTISLGSTFFEALTSLISEFDPLIVLSGGTLYILERSGAGALNTGAITPVSFTSRSVDREYIPIPGCIKVEGQEGKYIASKDPTATGRAYYGGGGTTKDEYSGRVTAPDGSTENYSIIEEYRDTSARDKVLIHRKQTSRLTDASGYSSYIEVIADYEHNSEDILKGNTETCKTEIGEDLIKYNIVSIIYEHNANLELVGQVTSKQELFIYDSDSGTYVAYDPRDYKLAELAEYEELVLITSEIRTTRYSYIDSETYGVETVIASKRYNPEEDEWQTLYTFEHDIVEAGGQQKTSSSSAKKTLQVYAGDCPFLPDLSIYDEPARIFNIPTPDWDSIEDCYAYLAALIAFEFQKVQANTPIIDPLPLMAISGLGSIIESGVQGYNYIRGYTINIESSRYTTELSLEARRA